MLKIVEKLHAAYRNLHSSKAGDRPVVAQETLTMLQTGAACEFRLADTYSQDSGALPTVVVVHGWGSRIFSNKTYTGAAERLRALGYHTLLVSLRGHEHAEGSIDTVSREDHAEDINAAFEYLAQRSEVDQKRLGVWGASYGAYMLACMPLRGIRLALFRAPALYPDEGWELPKAMERPGLAEWRRLTHAPSESLALRGVTQYSGALCIVWSTEDEQMPPSVLGSYVVAIGSDKPVEFLHGAKHTLNDDERERFLEILGKFFHDNYPKS